MTVVAVVLLLQSYCEGLSKWLAILAQASQLELWASL